MSPASIKAVTFDVGGTLIIPWPSVGHIYSEVAAANGCPVVPPQLLNQRFANAWKAAAKFEHSPSEWSDLVDATFSGLIERKPSRTFFSKLYERFAHPGAWHVFEEVVPTLQTLRSQRVKLGVISNWDERLRPLLRRLQLYPYFDSIVVSCEVGFPKPAAAIFARAANELVVPPPAILHVGDSLQLDVQGAQAAGFAAVLLDRKANSAGAGIVPSLRDLLDLL
jgi:putative hydrolase of the HAD superfamily